MSAVPAISPSFSSDLRAAREGDQEAFSRLMGPHWSRIRERANRHLLRSGGPYTASDVVQDVYAEAWSALRKFRGTSEAEYCAWFNRMVANRVLKAMRHRLAGARDERRNCPFPPGLAGLGGPAADDTTPFAKLSRGEDLERMAQAMARLAPDERQALLLRHGEGLSVDSIAEALDRSKGAVGGLLKRGMRKLRDDLVGTNGETS